MTDHKQWKIVPVEATFTMKCVGQAAWCGRPDGMSPLNGFGHDYSRAIAAAPASPFVMVSREDAEVIERSLSRAHDRLKQALEQESGQ